MAEIFSDNDFSALTLAHKIKQISIDNDNAMKAVERANQFLRSGWQSEAQKAYEECFIEMKLELRMYTELLAEYSDILTKVCIGIFDDDNEFADNIRSKFSLPPAKSYRIFDIKDGSDIKECITIDKDEALMIAKKIKQISIDNDNEMKELDKINKILRSGWQSEIQKAFEECIIQMKPKLNMYTLLLADYSDTLTSVVNFYLTTGPEYANNIREKFGR